MAGGGIFVNGFIPLFGGVLAVCLGRYSRLVGCCHNLLSDCSAMVAGLVLGGGRLACNIGWLFLMRV